MASEILLLSTLLVTSAAVIIYRIALWFSRRWMKGEDAGHLERITTARWRLGATLILSVGLGLMLSQVILSGADLLSPLVGSIGLGVIYAILGVGLTLTYAVVKLPNFAHGEMVTIGAYTMALASTDWHLPLPLAFTMAAVAGAALGLAQHLVVYRPLINRRARLVQIMIASFALSLSLRSIFWMFAVYGEKSIYHPISTTVLTKIKVPFTEIAIWDCTNSPTRDCRIGTAAVTDLFLWLLIVIIPLVIMLHLLLTRTLIGKSMRAVADNTELSQVTGINVEMIRQITWLLVGALAGLGGAFLGIAFPIDPELGWDNLLKVFATVTLGGLVSFYGTIAGGLIVGFAENWITVIGATNFRLPIGWQPFTVFLIIVLVLLIRPAGLTGLTWSKPSLKVMRKSVLIALGRAEDGA